MILRGAKVFLVGGVGVLALLIGLDNIFDYETNFAAVRHILSMDTIPRASPFLWRAIHNEAAHQLAKGVAILGLVIALSLYFVGFTVIGGEWFQMWRSDGWNMQEPAFRFVGAVGIMLLFLTQGDGDLPAGQ